MTKCNKANKITVTTSWRLLLSTRIIPNLSLFLKPAFINQLHDRRLTLTDKYKSNNNNIETSMSRQDLNRTMVGLKG